MVRLLERPLLVTQRLAAKGFVFKVPGRVLQRPHEDPKMRHHRRLLTLGAVALPVCLMFVGLPPLTEGAARAQTIVPATADTIPTNEVPFYSEWAGSPHALRSAEEFNHWNSAGQIPVECARCHSTPGFRAYVGADGSAGGVVAHPVPIGTVITCIACHNSKTLTLTSVTFPSGLTIDHQDANAICMTCHQGAESTNSVNKAIAGIGDDVVEPKLEFVNVHYTAAGAMLFGTMARVGYEYPGKTYIGRFQHQEPYTGCTNCHATHALDVKVTECAACHTGVTDKASLHKIRMRANDYDGSGDASEGMAQEIDSMRDRLLTAIKTYAKTVVGKPIAYDFDDFPYFFVDTNDNGIVDKSEAVFANRYKAWTPRLLKAAYNYQFIIKDPGAFAHNSTYALQLLYDSIADLGTKVNVDIAKAQRP